jgi:hypothetical protein
MHFNTAAFLVFLAFCGLLLVALSSGPASVHIAEAVVTIIMLLGISGYTWQRSRRR